MTHTLSPTAAEPRVGPNAITQMIAALQDGPGPEAAERVCEAANLAAYLAHPPTTMIPQGEAIAVHRAAFAVLGSPLAEQVAHEAGVRTGAYLLAHRIPAPARWLLRALPAGMAARVLLLAIAQHAWTFVGSGVFTSASGPRGAVIEVERNPLATQPCAWHCGVFEKLFTELVCARARVRESACAGAGEPSCRFEIDWT